MNMQPCQFINSLDEGEMAVTGNNVAGLHADRFVVLFCSLVAAFWFGMEYGKQSRPQCKQYDGYTLSSQVDWKDNRECIYRPIHGVGIKKEIA